MIVENFEEILKEKISSKHVMRIVYQAEKFDESFCFGIVKKIKDGLIFLLNDRDSSLHVLKIDWILKMLDLSTQDSYVSKNNNGNNEKKYGDKHETNL